MNYYYDTEFAEDGVTIDLISLGMVSEDGREFYMESSEFDEEKCNDWVKKNVLPKLGPKESRKTKAEIRQALLDFIGDDKGPRFIAYVGAYDHLCLVQLWGPMVTLPPHFPHYTWDLKQKLEELDLGKNALPNQDEKGDHNALEDAKWVKMACEFLKKNHNMVIPANKKKEEASAMVAVLYQLFLLDPKAEKKDMLIAVDPPFTSPNAVDSVLKATKFESKDSLTVIGLEEKINDYLKAVERKDSTEWMDLEVPERKAAMVKLADELGLESKEKLRENECDEQVLGDEEEVVNEVAAAVEVTAVKKPYPVDLPPGNRDIWDAVGKQPDFLTGWGLLKRAGKHKDQVVAMAVYRNFYEAYATKMNKIPWNNITKTQISDQRTKLKGFIIQGEEAAKKMIDDLVNHLMHADLIHKSKAQKFGGVCRHPDSNHYLLVHTVPWVLKPEKHSWLQIAGFIKREFGKILPFREERNKLKAKLNTKGTVPTELEIERTDENTIHLYVNHYLTEDQAALLTQETDHDRIAKRMNAYCNHWYKSGKFPKIDDEDFD